MGITTNCAKFLAFSKSLGVTFDNTLMLGRQQLFVSKNEFIHHAKQFTLSVNENVDLNENEGYAEPLFKMLGAKSIDSMDVSNYEKATILHDLNNPIPENLKGKYSLIFDGGTLEHVFNFPIAIKNCMDAIKPGGHFISITPTNNLCGHGFYQFSPELFFSVFNEQNGFESKLIILAVEVPGVGIRDWYKVANPKVVKKRVTLQNDHQTYLLVLARKISDIPNDQLTVQQSDYENIWNVFSSVQTNQPLKNENKIWFLYRKFTPRICRDLIHKVMGLAAKSEKRISGIGTVNSSFFEKMNL